MLCPMNSGKMKNVQGIEHFREEMEGKSYEEFGG